MSLTRTILNELSGAGVRFLKKHPVYHQWYVADPKVGRDKIGHFLRDNYNKPDSSGVSTSSGGLTSHEDSVASINVALYSLAAPPTEEQQVQDSEATLGHFLSHGRFLEWSVPNQGDLSSVWKRQRKVGYDLNQNLQPQPPTTNNFSGFSLSEAQNHLSENDATFQLWPRHSAINSEIRQTSVVTSNKNQDFVPMTKNALMKASTFQKSEGLLFSNFKSAPSVDGLDAQCLQNITRISKMDEFRHSFLSSRHDGPSDSKSYNFRQENSHRVGSSSSSSSSASSNNSGANFRGIDLISPSIQSIYTDKDNDDDDELSLFDESDLAQCLDW